MRKIILISILSLSIFMIAPGFMNTSDTEIFVHVKYKSQPDKSEQALNELKSLIKKVKEEPNYISITIYSDPSDPSQILLSEHWKSEAYYKGDHMKTEHLRKFIADSRNFLAGPPDITFWKKVE